MQMILRLKIVAVLVVAVSGCGLVQPKPDLERLYATARDNVDQPPVIIIPGLMGSKLASSEDGEIWIGSLWDLAFSEYRNAALDIDPETLLPDPGDVRVTRITGKFAGRNFYQPIIDMLEDAGGFRRAEAGTSVDPSGRYYY